MISLSRNWSWSKTKCIRRLLGLRDLNSTVSQMHQSDPHTGEAEALSGPAPALRQFIKKGPGLEYFLYNSAGSNKESVGVPERHPYLDHTVLDGMGRKVFVEVYGCQMNVNDTEIVHAILKKHNYCQASSVEDASVVLLMTCAIREGAEQKIWNRLIQLRNLKRERETKWIDSSLTVGLIGCMAERLKDQLLERDPVVDIICGPDSYRSLPYLLSQSSSHQAAVDVILSFDETYADVTPVRLNPSSPSAYVSIMRGCDNMCTYCIVPFTRGKERSRPIDSIIDEVRNLSTRGIKEITLLGQNVNSYRDTSESNHFVESAFSARESGSTVSGFTTVYKAKVGGRRFADLLDRVSLVDPEIRIRFTAAHPKDFPDHVLQLINERPNICKSLHLPVQSGSDRVLSLMRRNYTRQAYLDLVDHVRSVCGPDVALSSDFICGFCGETEEEFDETLDLVQRVGYTSAFIFPYSMREKTTAHRRYIDDVPLTTKNERTRRLVTAFRQGAELINRKKIGSTQLVLVEGESKRSDQFLVGRCDSNVRVIFPKERLPSSLCDSSIGPVMPGEYVTVKVHDATSQVLKGRGLRKCTLAAFYGNGCS